VACTSSRSAPSTAHRLDTDADLTMVDCGVSGPGPSSSTAERGTGGWARPAASVPPPAWSSCARDGLELRKAVQIVSRPPDHSLQFEAGVVYALSTAALRRLGTNRPRALGEAGTLDDAAPQPDLYLVEQQPLECWLKGGRSRTSQAPSSPSVGAMAEAYDWTPGSATSSSRVLITSGRPKLYM
jgi:hypothetical protein